MYIFALQEISQKPVASESVLTPEAGMAPPTNSPQGPTNAPCDPAAGCFLSGSVLRGDSKQRWEFQKRI